MPADFAASTLAARSSKKTMASGDETFARSIATLYMSGMRFAQPDLVRRNRELEELDDPQLVRVALPVQLVRVAQRAPADNACGAASSSSFAPGSTRRDHVVNFARNSSGVRSTSQSVDEPLGPHGAASTVRARTRRCAGTSTQRCRITSGVDGHRRCCPSSVSPANSTSTPPKSKRRSSGCEFR